MICKNCVSYEEKSEGWLYCAEGGWGGAMVPCCTFNSSGIPIDEEVFDCGNFTSQGQPK